MHLNVDLFQQILKQIRSDRRDANDMRLSGRVGLTALATIATAAEPKDHPIRIRDLSKAGVGLLHHAPLEVGQAFVLRIAQARSRAAEISCQVIHCRSVSGGLYCIGAKFTSQVLSQATAA